MKHIGTDRTLERGPVNVFWSDTYHEAYVAAIDAPKDKRGRPSGLRVAPMGTRFSALALKGEKSLAKYGSPDFRPV